MCDISKYMYVRFHSMWDTMSHQNCASPIQCWPHVNDPVTACPTMFWSLALTIICSGKPWQLQHAQRMHERAHSWCVAVKSRCVTFTVEWTSCTPSMCEVSMLPAALASDLLCQALADTPSCAACRKPANWRVCKHATTTWRCYCGTVTGPIYRVGTLLLFATWPPAVGQASLIARPAFQKSTKCFHNLRFKWTSHVLLKCVPSPSAWEIRITNDSKGKKPSLRQN